MKTFNEQKILITGASRGIGRTIAEEFIKLGATVIGTATTESRAKALETEMIKAGFTSFKGFGLDVKSDLSVQELAEKIKPYAETIDILINNAGITRDNLLMRMKSDEWTDVIETNLNGIFRVTKTFVKGMVKARAGRIINISSVVSSTGNPGQTNYVSTKAAIEGFTRALARELARRNITVNAVAPGYIKTDMTDQLDVTQQQVMINQIPLNRIGTPEDIFAAIKFLCSPEAGYITGQTIHVNGGMYMN